MKLTKIYRYPVKSVGYETVESVSLTPGAPMPGDRLYAIAHGKSDWDAASPEWLRCVNFLRVANIPALAALRVAFNPEAGTLQLWDKQGDVWSFNLATDVDALLAKFASYAETILPGPYSLASLAGATFTDSSEQTPSLMSFASLRALSADMGCELDPRRFRGNFWIDDAEPWAELNWVGRQVQIGDVRFEVQKPIVRCVATAANPESGERDHNPLVPLKRLHGEPLFGVLVQPINPGEIAVGDRVVG
jgi:uncharacterized protein YcbX